MVVATHNFQRSLAESHAVSEEAWWEKVYRQRFPDFLSMSYIAKDGWAQRAGIDRIIVLKCGKTITIDEKVRSKGWGDILLEFKSSVEHNTPGWIEKALACDYICYALPNTQQAYFLDFQLLRKVWSQQGEAWKKQFQIIRAKNGRYTTESVAVPVRVVMQALHNEDRVFW